MAFPLFLYSSGQILSSEIRWARRVQSLHEVGKDRGVIAGHTKQKEAGDRENTSPKRVGAQ